MATGSETKEVRFVDPGDLDALNIQVPSRSAKTVQIALNARHHRRSRAQGKAQSDVGG